MKHSPGFLRAVERVMGEVREVSVAEVRRWQAEGRLFEFVDVREDREWEAGHAAGAWHLGRGVLERDIESKVTEKDRVIVLYCGGGYRSALAAKSLQDMGYKSVWSMAGGYRAWQEDPP